MANATAATAHSAIECDVIDRMSETIMLNRMGGESFETVQVQALEIEDRDLRNFAYLLTLDAYFGFGVDFEPTKAADKALLTTYSFQQVWAIDCMGIESWMAQVEEKQSSDQ